MAARPSGFLQQTVAAPFSVSLAVDATSIAPADDARKATRCLVTSFVFM
jgi:hypothetical protein